MLTCRLKGTENGANPVRIICDSTLRTPLESQIVRSAKEIPTILATCNRQEAMHMPYIEAGCKILVTPEKDGHVDLSDLMDSCKHPIFLLFSTGYPSLKAGEP